MRLFAPSILRSVLGCLPAVVLMASACGGGGGDGGPTPPPPAAPTITLSASTIDLNGLSATAPLSASVTPPSAAVAWRSENAATATVSGSGTAATVTAVAAGTTTVVAAVTLGSQTAEARVTVRVLPVVRSLAVSPAAPQITVGQTRRLIVTPTADAGADTRVQWTTSDAARATVDTTGLVTAITPGSATITVRSIAVPTVTASVAVTLLDIPRVRAVVLAPSVDSAEISATRTYTATVTADSGVARTLTWRSSSPSIATVSASGVATAISAGSTSISARSTVDSTIFGTATFLVRAPAVSAVSMSTDSLDVPIRVTTTLVATPRDAAGQPLVGRTVTWQSSAPTTASVSSTGVVRMLLPGTVTITATAEGRTGTTRVRGSVANLSTIVDSIRQATGLPAMGGMIVSREGIVAQGVGGFRRIGGAQPVTINDKWHLGSNTKAITGMLAGMAVDAGALTWDRTVEQAFPDLAATMRAEYRPVTLRELLSHVGGLTNSLQGLTASTNLPAARTAWMNTTFQAAPNGPRGQYNYSNSSFGAAGAIIERAWNSTYENLISTKLLQPLGVTGAGWGPTTGVGGIDQPVGHQRVNNAWIVCEACDNAPGLSSAGTLHAPLAAWARIMQELLLADQGRSTVLTQSSARLLTTNAVPVGGGASYGFGWVVSSGTPGSRSVAHDGSNTINHSRAVLFLDAGVAFLITINAADLTGGLTPAALNAMQLRLDRYWTQGR